jgi:hypothetical protein
MLTEHHSSAIPPHRPVCKLNGNVTMTRLEAKICSQAMSIQFVKYIQKNHHLIPTSHNHLAREHRGTRGRVRLGASVQVVKYTCVVLFVRAREAHRRRRLVRRSANNVELSTLLSHRQHTAFPLHPCTKEWEEKMYIPCKTARPCSNSHCAAQSARRVASTGPARCTWG